MEYNAAKFVEKRYYAERRITGEVVLRGVTRIEKGFMAARNSQLAEEFGSVLCSRSSGSYNDKSHSHRRSSPWSGTVSLAGG
jgi:hypothetical protein